MVGQAVRATSPQGSFAQSAGQLDGRVLVEAAAYGKNLVVAFEGALAVHVHLGMFGSFSVRLHRRALRDGWLRTDPPTTGAERLRLLTRTHVGDVRRPLVLELLDPAGVSALTARLGRDPLRPDHDPGAAVTALNRSRREIGLLLIDQAVVAGIGNVYRAELLFRAGLSPWTPGADLARWQLESLWADAIHLMSIGVDAGWIITDDRQIGAAIPYLEAGQQVPRWAKVYAVYGRAGQPCRRCGAPVESAPQGRQRTFWCPCCQPDERRN